MVPPSVRGTITTTTGTTVGGARITRVSGGSSGE